MILGYARVSTKDQNIDLQINALKKAGCEKIFQEKASGRKESRPELDKLLAHLRPGDILLVHSLDRLGRTMKQLVELMAEFKTKGVQFKSISEGVFDTTSPMGEAIFQIMAVLKAMEVNILRDRTLKGLEAASLRGRKGGRPKGSYNEIKAAAAVSLYKENTSIDVILTNLNISRATLYVYLRKKGVDNKRLKKKG
jgi:DNA invertase Pin-like site-specific DNA recombinase